MRLYEFNLSKEDVEKVCNAMDLPPHIVLNMKSDEDFIMTSDGETIVKKYFESFDNPFESLMDYLKHYEEIANDNKREFFESFTSLFGQLIELENGYIFTFFD